MDTTLPTVPSPGSNGDERWLRDIPGHTVGERLDEGGMGSVYLAQQHSPPRTVALKTIRSDLTHEDPATVRRLRSRFEREANAMAQLNHANVVPIFTAGNVEGRLYLTMEFLADGSVEKLRNDHGGRLRSDEALTVLHQAAQGLLGAESKGIVHRDIKPTNLLVELDRKGRLETVKVADFGAAIFEHGTQTLPVGTPGFSSPEQWRRGAVDRRSDIYSLGVTLYYLLTGCDIPSEHVPLLNARERNEDVPEGLNHVIKVMTAYQRRDRYQSFEELIADVERVRLGEAPRAPSPPLQLAGFADDPLVGTLLGKYELKECLGHGPGTVVYRASDHGMERSVVIKTVGPALPPDDRTIGERLRDGANRTAGLTSPHIVRVWEHGEHGGRMFLAREYVNGSNLHGHVARLQAKKLAPDQAVSLMLEAASGLRDAARGVSPVVHGRITPQNLLVPSGGEDRRLKVSDFGGAGGGERESAHASPEQRDGERVDIRSDIYALGSVFSEAVAGHPISAHAQQRSPRIFDRSVPRELDRVLGKATAWEPRSRYQTWDELIQELMLLKELKPPRAPARGHKVGWALAAAALILSGVGLWWATRPGGGDRGFNADVARYASEFSGANRWNELRGRVQKRLADPLVQLPGEVVAQLRALDPRVEQALLLVTSFADLRQRADRDQAAPPDWSATRQLLEGSVGLRAEVEAALAAADEFAQARVELTDLEERWGNQKNLASLVVAIEALRGSLTKRVVETPCLRGLLDKVKVLAEAVGPELARRRKKLAEVGGEIEGLETISPEDKSRLKSELSLLDGMGELDFAVRLGELQAMLSRVAMQGGASGPEASTVHPPVAFVDKEVEALWGRFGPPFAAEAATKLHAELKPQHPRHGIVAQLRDAMEVGDGFESTVRAALQPAGTPECLDHLKGLVALSGELGQDIERTEWAVWRKNAQPELDARIRLVLGGELAAIRQHADRLGGEAGDQRDRGKLGKIEADVGALRQRIVQLQEVAGASYEEQLEDATTVRALEAVDTSIAGAREAIDLFTELDTCGGKLTAAGASLSSWRASGSDTEAPLTELSQRIETWRQSHGTSHGRHATALEESLGGLRKRRETFASAESAFAGIVASVAAAKPTRARTDLEPWRKRVPWGKTWDPLDRALDALEDAFDELRNRLDLGQAEQRFVEALRRFQELPARPAEDYVKRCRNRLQELAKVTRNMAPVARDTVRIDGGDPRQVESFFIDCCEVSRKLFLEFLAQAKQKPELIDPSWPRERMLGAWDAREGHRVASTGAKADLSWPVELVTFAAAQAYAHRHEKSLPTLAQWWLAAKGSEGRLYPWGSEWVEDVVQSRPVPVDEGGVSHQMGHDIHHLSGNVAEWLLDLAGAKARLVIGGSYEEVTRRKHYSGEERAAREESARRPGVGFRCVVSVPGWFGGLWPRS